MSSPGYGFSSGHVWMWELDCRESWAPKYWCFWTVVLEKTLESPLDCKEIKPVNPKRNQSWIFIGRIDADAETLIVWPPDVKNLLIGKDPDAREDWRQEEKGTREDEMVGWHHWLNGHEFEQRLQRSGLNWATEQSLILQLKKLQRNHCSRVKSKVLVIWQRPTLSTSQSTSQYFSVVSESLWPMDCSMPGFPVHNHLPELAQTHVYLVSDAIQSSHPCHLLLLLPSIFPSIRVFSNEMTLCNMWPKYWHFSFSISPSNEYPGLISIRID